MDHELLDQKGDFFADHDDTYSSLKHEFSRIFHENNLHSFANASDIGFLEIGKFSSRGYGDYEEGHGLGEMDTIMGRSYPKEEQNSYVNVGMHNMYSPMRFLQPANSAVNYNYQNVTSSMSQKQQPIQDSSYLPPYAPYKYSGDFSYMDFAPAPNMFPQNVYDIYNQSDMMDTHPNNPLTMMWTNEIPKGPAKATSADDFLQSSSHTTAQSKKLSAASSIDTQKKTPFKVEQDFDKVSNKVLGLQMDRVVKSIPEGTTASGPRRTNRITKPVYNKNSIEEDEEDSGSDDDKEDAFGDTKNRSSRGLRVLSLKVRDIVSKKKKTSYKEVAEALLQDLSQKLKGKSQAEISKEEQNVKRRVYDALNVLIAAEILRKEGKLVCCEPAAANIGIQGKKKVKQDREGILEQIQEIKKRKKEKIETLQELVFKGLAIKNLVRRNKEKAEREALEAKMNDMAGQKTRKVNQSINAKTPNVNATRIDVIQENPSFKQKTQDVINFPFIVLLSSSPENSMNLNMDTTQKQLSIESKKPFNIFGDIDVLLKMKLHYVSKESFEKEVPKNLQRFVSQSFVEALN